MCARSPSSSITDVLRMHARSRSLAPALPALVRAGDAPPIGDRHRAACQDDGCGRRRDSRRRWPAVRQNSAWPTNAEDVRRRPGFRQARDEPSSRALNCAREEDDAFWCWAVVEALRLTGLRCEELLELSHLSIRQYRPADGKAVVLLQIAPSKMDRERVIPVCPELVHALARIVARVRGDSEAVPLAQRWDPYEQSLSPPMPFLFQRRENGSQCVIGWSSVVGLLDRAARNAGIRDVDGQPLVFRPHDLRRIFATDAVNGGLPVYIAAKLLVTWTSTPPRSMWPCTTTRSSAMFRRTSRAGGQRGCRKSIASPLLLSGRSLSSISVAAGWRSATAIVPTGRTVRTSTRVSVVPCCAWIRTNSRVSC
jgi:Phage integrase family